MTEGKDPVMPFASSPGECVVCDGLKEAADTVPGDVTCSTHFLDWLDRDGASVNRSKDCPECGWPREREAKGCSGPHIPPEVERDPARREEVDAQGVAVQYFEG